MQTTTRSATLATLFFLASSLTSGSIAGSPRITHHPAIATTDFAERWSWGDTQTRQGSHGGWLGYAIDLWMDPDHFLVSGRGFTIGHGGKIYTKGEPLTDLLDGRAIDTGIPGVVNTQRPGQIRRTLAVLIRIDSRGRVGDVHVTDLTFAADLKGLPLAWLGPASADESFHLVTTLYAKAEQSRTKEDVTEAVGLHDRPEAVDVLARVLGSDDPTSVREEAAEALACQSDRRSLDLLVRTARGDRSPGVREEAVEALGESRVEGADAAVIDLARHADSSHVRAEAVETLGDLATPAALDTLRDILWNGTDVEVQEEALETLADRSAADVLSLLIEVARHHPKTAIREEAIEALAEMAADRVAGTLEDLAYHDANLDIREEAIEALGELSGGAGIAILVRVASTHPEAEMREEALDALADAGEDHPRARRALETLGSI